MILRITEFMLYFTDLAHRVLSTAGPLVDRVAQVPGRSASHFAVGIPRAYAGCQGLAAVCQRGPLEFVFGVKIIA
jgi:hypothetical protein